MIVLNRKMSLSFNTPGDVIDTLPTDQSQPSHVEIQILDNLFKQTKTGANRILSNSKDVLLVGILYIIFSLPQLDPYIVKFIPSASSPYTMIFVKALGVMILYFIISNWYLCRK
jgi:hypothetical protein